MMKGYKYVKKNQIDPVNIIRCKPYNKQVFIQTDLRFSTAINL